MTRISKVGEIRRVSPKRPRVAGKKTGRRQDNLPQGYKVHTNAVEGSAFAEQIFIPKVKG